MQSGSGARETGEIVKERSRDLVGDRAALPPLPSKVGTLEEALEVISDGCTLMFGGFGGVGTPPTLIEGLLAKGVRELVLIGNDTGFPHIGIGRLVTAGRAKKVIASHIGSNPNAGRQMEDGSLEVEFYPQGTLAEKIRAGGVGLGGILVDVGIGTIMEQGRERVTVGGRPYLVEPALTADVAIVHARQADPFGNLVFDKSGRNFNPLVAMAGRFTIAEADEIVPFGALDPEHVVTPGIFVHMVIPSKGVNWEWAWEKKAGTGSRSAPPGS
ncbi:CoA transferase subunit A [Paenibacillus cremeus]|uniref:CoA transferase subunit A n=2 Tax=Paenibacillus cremeus TaxID=2163881 RepID=A0A559JK78_9BACL|nr:CoA transferase subunit A [Paenibacillus cremeus]